MNDPALEELANAVRSGTPPDYGRLFRLQALAIARHGHEFAGTVLESIKTGDDDIGRRHPEQTNVVR